MKLKPARVLSLVVVLAVPGLAQAGWNRLPYAESRPIDLAPAAISGAQLVSSHGLSNAPSLVHGDLNEAVTLAGGQSSAVIQLRRQQMIQTLSFTNDGAEGKISVSASPDKKDWTALGAEAFAAGERVVHVHLAAASGKYLQVNFDSPRGGSIRAFSIFGGSTEKDYRLKPSSSAEGGFSINLASAVGGAHAIYAFPTPVNVGELNHQHNVFRFSKTRDKYRTVVYDLGGSRMIKEFAASYTRCPVRIEVFAFDEVPEKKDWRGKLTFDPAVLNAAKPIAQGEDARDTGHIKLAPGKSVRAKCIVLRFEPNFQASVAGRLMESGVLPESRWAKGKNDSADEFTIGGVQFNSAGGYDVVQKGGEGDHEENGKKNSDDGSGNDGNTKVNASSYESGGNNNYTGVGVPYVSGAPSAPAASLPTASASSSDDDGKGKAKGKEKDKGDHGEHGAPHSP